MMSTELYKELAQRGVDPRGLNLVAFGGAGPTQAALLAEEARLESILVPLSPGTFCAHGAIQSDVRRDYVRSLRMSLQGGQHTVTSVNTALAEMESQALAWIATQGQQLGDALIERSADMRYDGQAYDLRIALLDDPGSEDAASMAQRFHDEHAAIYGFPDHDSAVEVMTVRVSVTRAMPAVVAPVLAAAKGALTAQGQRDVRLRDKQFTADVYHRSDLRPGHILVGPAVIEQADTTIWVLPDWRAMVHPEGTLEMRHQRLT
jgi:N-methylhydantoinase A